MKSIRKMSIDISRKLKNIPDRMVQVVDEISSDVLEEVKANANYNTGTFVESLYKEPATKGNDKIVSFVGSNLMVTSSLGQSYNLGYLLENGTNPHEIFPVNAEALKFEINGKTIYAKKVNHTGTRPYLFYHNARINNMGRFGQKVSQIIKEELKK